MRNNSRQTLYLGLRRLELFPQISNRLLRRRLTRHTKILIGMTVLKTARLNQLRLRSPPLAAHQPNLHSGSSPNSSHKTKTKTITNPETALMQPKVALYPGKHKTNISNSR